MDWEDAIPLDLFPKNTGRSELPAEDMLFRRPPEAEGLQMKRWVLGICFLLACVLCGFEVYASSSPYIDTCDSVSDKRSAAPVIDQKNYCHLVNMRYLPHKMDWEDAIPLDRRFIRCGEVRQSM